MNTKIENNKKIQKTITSKPVINLIETGKNIKKFRLMNGYSVHDLQEIFNFSYPQAIYSWQDGRSVPTVDNLLVLSRLFGVSIEQIIATDEIIEIENQKSA